MLSPPFEKANYPVVDIRPLSCNLLHQKNVTASVSINAANASDYSWQSS